MANKIAIMMHTTFCRFEDAKKTINSFRNNPIFKIYISDTGALTPSKLDYYRELEKEGHQPYIMSWDLSPAITRNYMIDRMSEKYVWKVDDDFIFNQNIKPQEILKILGSDDRLGLVGMKVEGERKESPFIYDIERQGNKAQLKRVDVGGRQKFLGNNEYYYCDVTPDCWIAKTEIFPECNYDEQYHVSEGLHTDFFFHIKYNTDWRVAYTPSHAMHHTKWDKRKYPNQKSYYMQKRFRNINSRDKFKRKWGIKEINKL